MLLSIIMVKHFRVQNESRKITTDCACHRIFNDKFCFELETMRKISSARKPGIVQRNEM